MVEVELQTQKAGLPAGGPEAPGPHLSGLGNPQERKNYSLQEALDGLSALRVGVEQKNSQAASTCQTSITLLILIQPAHLAKIAARELNPEQEAMERARLVGNVIENG